MTAATLTFDVTDLALEKVHVVEAKTRPPLPHVIADAIVRALGGYVAGLLEKKARELAELAVWFNGAVVTLQQESVNAPVDINDRLVPALEEAEVHLLDMRARVLKLSADIEASGHRGRIVGALRAVARAGADLHESILHFKWAVMESDADVDVNHGNFEVFDSPDALIASMNR